VEIVEIGVEDAILVRPDVLLRRQADERAQRVK
jgi:hypothetical protein